MSDTEIPVSKPRITIHYCNGCRWLLRAAWYAQELLSTFHEELAEVALAPSSGGRFQIWVDTQKIWCREENGGFPEIRELKQKVRNIIAPSRALGHIDPTTDKEAS